MWDIAGGVTQSQVDRALKELEKDGKKVGAVLITSPTYNDICSNVQGIVDVCHPLHILALETKDQLMVITGVSVLDLPCFASDFPAIYPLRPF